jgi:thymidine phosphorylase
MVAAQGGDLEAARPVAPALDVAAPHKGYVTEIDCESLGHAVAELGGARRKVEDAIDLSVGLEMLVRVGDAVEAGQPLLRLFTNAKGREAARHLAERAITIADAPCGKHDLVVDRIT